MSPFPATMREDIAADAATVRNGAALRPDVVIDRSGPQELGGRKFEVHLARDAVTAGDVWIHEPRTRVAVLGDLVTLPAPFLDTACPQGWLEALQEIERTDFLTAIPGHGKPLNRAQFGIYHSSLAAVHRLRAFRGTCGDVFHAVVDCGPTAAVGGRG